MPYLTETTPFTGDNDLADFLSNVYLPFARDECQWSDNTPIRSPEVVSPEAELWLSRQDRSGSPITIDSPHVTQPPYTYLRTSANGKHLMHFAGIGVDDTQEAFDQPENPMNCPQNADYGIADGAQNSGTRCIVTNELQGTFDKYWMFSDDLGTYIHCVIKVTTRQYRHFHVGLLTPLHPDLSDDAFYTTGQFWEQLDPTALSSQSSQGTPPANGEHEVYGQYHRNPFWGNGRANETGPGGIRAQWTGGWFYMPGIVENSPEITWFKPFASDHLTVQEHMGVPLQKHLGDVNETDDAVFIGCAGITGSPDGLGVNLFSADRTFTSNAVPLIPIYVGGNTTFAGDVRLGMVAQVPDVFRINMKNLAPEQEILVGSDTYVVFPLINDDAANVLAGEGYSGYEGLAYKKIDNGSVP